MSVIVDMPAAEYHALDRLNASAMRDLLRSVRHYAAARAKPKLPSASMMLGTAIHAAVLEPDRWEASAVEIGEFVHPDTGKKARLSPGSYAETWDAAVRSAPPGAIVVAEGQREIVEEIAVRVEEHPAALDLIAHEDRVAEVTMLWGEGDVPCKCRADLIVSGTIVDLKTTSDASAAEFRRSVAKYGYHRQAAWYLRGAWKATGRVLKHRIIAVETEPPYGVAVYEIDEPALLTGMAEAQMAVQIYRDWLARQVETGYDEGVQSLGLPAYLLADESVFRRTDIFAEGSL